jgi:hypothetical protein
MLTSHHREVIDDHMNDSNWKKLVDLGRLPPTGTASELTEIMLVFLQLELMVFVSWEIK